MSKLKAYIEDSYNELVHKVTWPTWSDLQSSAILVMISSVIIALVIFAMDITFSNSMELFYDLFK
jgi:preprotein translocase subunit SecE